MQSVVGIFRSLSDASQAVTRLRQNGIPENKINLLAPGPFDQERAELSEVPISETEQPGMGKGVGSLLGGSVGVAGGLSLGTAVASIFVPGVGPVIAAGLAAAALLGAGGAVAGAKVGDAFERANTQGLPEDELFFYEDALRRGRTVVIAFADDDSQLETARRVLRESGAESLDAARESWWIGVRDAEREHYQAPGQDVAEQESIYRSGFEAGLRPSVRGKSYQDVREQLRPAHPTDCDHPLFARGFERGQQFRERNGEAATKDPRAA